MIEAIQTYHAAQTVSDRAICDLLYTEISQQMGVSEAKIWHGSPVWFIAGNPIVGYHKLKGCVRLLFWSGQGFAAPGLCPEGSFKAAEARYTEAGDVDVLALRSWLAESRTVQYDYKSIRKNKGRLDLLDVS